MPDDPRRIHNYTKRCWGHDFTLTPHADPVTADITGWGHGLRKHDFLLIPRQAGGTCIYKIETLRWANNVDDMWFATCRFVPGSSELGARIGAAMEKPSVSALVAIGELGGWWVLDG